MIILPPSLGLRLLLESMVRGPNSRCKVQYSLGKDDNCVAQTGLAVDYGAACPWSKLEVQSVVFPR